MRFQWALVLAGAVFVASLGGPAFADHGQRLSVQQRAQVVEQSGRLGMTAAATRIALRKLDRGEVPDSDSGSVAPVTTEIVRSGYTVTETATFPDGSVQIVSYPDLEAMTKAVENGTYIQARGVSGCQYVYTSAAITWTNCKIEASNIFMIMAYRLNATRVRGRDAYISSVWDNAGTSILGTFSHTFFGLASRTQALYKVRHTGVAGSSSRSVSLTTTISSAGSLSVSMATS